MKILLGKASKVYSLGENVEGKVIICVDSIRHKGLSVRGIGVISIQTDEKESGFIVAGGLKKPSFQRTIFKTDQQILPPGPLHSGNIPCCTHYEKPTS